MRIASTSIAIAALSCTAAAQLISPVISAKTEGNGNNTYPFFGNTFHYQQVHGDLGPTPQVIKGLSFRRDGLTNTSSLGKTVTAAIWMGNVAYSALSSTYANNYDAFGRTAVLPSGAINLPAMPAKPATPPAAFTATIPFKATFLHVGVKALVWEYVCTGSSSTAPYTMDAVSTGIPKRGPYTRLGTGCIATGQTRNMLATAYVSTYRSPDRLRYFCYTSYGTKTAVSAILVGSANPNVAFPICNKTLYTNADLAMIPANSNTTGIFRTSTSMYFPWNPSFAGLKIYSQTYSSDAAMGPLPIAVSNGVESTVPTLGLPPGMFARIHSYYNATATSGGLDVGFAVVTRFD